MLVFTSLLLERTSFANFFAIGLRANIFWFVVIYVSTSKKNKLSQWPFSICCIIASISILSIVAFFRLIGLILKIFNEGISNGMPNLCKATRTALFPDIFNSLLN